MKCVGVCLFAMGCLLSVMLPAAAADLPVKAPNVATNMSWTGVYVGANGGWARAGRIDGAEAGGQIGINYQVGQLVFGAEGDLQWTDVNTTGLLGLGLVTEKLSLKYFGTARGRMGFAFDRGMVYGTGGLAYSSNKHEGTGTGLVAGTYNASNTVAGWTAGGGVEWMLPDPHWSAKIEYLYAHFESHTNRYTSLAIPFTVIYSPFHMDIVRAGLNYRF